MDDWSRAWLVVGCWSSRTVDLCSPLRSCSTHRGAFSDFLDTFLSIVYTFFHKTWKVITIQCYYPVLCAPTDILQRKMRDSHSFYPAFHIIPPGSRNLAGFLPGYPALSGKIFRNISRIICGIFWDNISSKCGNFRVGFFQVPTWDPAYF